MLQSILDLIDFYSRNLDLSPRRQEVLALTLAKALDSDYLWSRQKSVRPATSESEREAIAGGTARAAGSRTLDTGDRIICALVPRIPTRTRFDTLELLLLKAHFSEREIVDIITLVGFNLMLARMAELVGCTVADDASWPSLSRAAAPAYEDLGGSDHGATFRAPY